MGMSMKSRKELTQATTRRYRGCGRTEKGQILDEFCHATGYARSYAATLLRQYGRGRLVGGGGSATRLTTSKRARKAGGRPRVYDKQAQRAVVNLWRRFGYVCGKRLVPLIRQSIDDIRDDPFLKATEQLCGLLAQISAASIDRLLREERKKYLLKGHSYTKTRGGLYDLIPVRTFGEWIDVPPGHVQMDTVGHDGGYGSADCAFSLCVTDVCLGWTEKRALQNRAAKWVIGALDEIREAVPFPIVHMHPDNGSEFININVKDYCDRHHIDLSRSRPERKNDNCYVEQKNFDAIRKLVGYARYSSPQALDTLNELYRLHGLFQNYFLPSQKLISKTRNGSKVTKHNDRPQSPADRLLAHPDIPPAVKDLVRQRRAQLKPLALADQITELKKRVLRLADHSGSHTRKEAVS